MGLLKIKFILIIAILFTVAFSMKAQKSTIVNETFDYNLLEVESGQGKIIAGFSPIKGYFNDHLQLPILSFSTKINFDNVDFQIDSYETEELSSEELKWIEIENVAQELSTTLHVVKQGLEKYASIECPAVIWNAGTGKIEKIIGIKGSLQQKNLNTFRQKSFKLNSVLSSGSGQWYKIGIEKEGMYKVDYNFLQNNGINVTGLNSSSISVYGNDMGMLSHQNGVQKEDDLLKKSIAIFDGGDGKFEPGDYFVFYAKGPHDVFSNGQEWLHTKNCYTDSAYYFINISSTPNSTLVGSANLSTGSTTHTITKFNDFVFLEDDVRNLTKSGTEWLGDVFDVQLANSYIFSFPNISLTDSVLIRSNIGISSPVANNSSACEFVISSGGKSINLKPSSGS